MIEVKRENCEYFVAKHNFCAYLFRKQKGPVRPCEVGQPCSDYKSIIPPGDTGRAK